VILGSGLGENTVGCAAATPIWFAWARRGGDGLGALLNGDTHGHFNCVSAAGAGTGSCGGGDLEI